MNEVLQFLKECGYYFLATEDGSQARVRPFGTAEIFEGHLYIQTGKAKNVYKQISKNPNVEICAYNPTSGKWIIICGNLIADERVEAKKHMLDNYPSLRGMYDEHDDNTIVLYFEKGEATFSSFVEAPRTIKF